MASRLVALVRAFHLVHGYAGLMGYALRNLKVLDIEPVRVVFHRQIYFTGVQALAIVAVLALLCGSLVVTQVTNLVGGNSELTVKVLIWTLVQEVGPLLAAIIIVARSSAAIASELALMKNHQELDALSQMHIPPLDYLVVPRLAGVTLAVIALSIYFQVIAIGGGLAISAAFQNVSFAEQLNRFWHNVALLDLALVAVKGGLFGVMIATISCYQGLHAAPSLTAVPNAAIRAVMQSLFAVFLVDALLAYWAH